MTRPSSPTPAWSIAIAGLLALAVAMGIGRFAFTPLMPLMMRDGLIDGAAGAELAAANYIGYLVGALSASRLGRQPLRLLRRALIGVVLLTLLATGAASAGSAAFWWLLRFGAGACSAWVLVAASSWCLHQLARLGASTRGAWIYIGVGTGIAAAGALAWLGGQQTSRLLWLQLGLLAAAGALAVMVLLRGWRDDQPAPAGATPPAASASGHTALMLCYGAFGFGYIVPATFLPALARQQVDDPLVFGLAWPLFGLAAALSIVGAARWLARWPRRRVWALAQSVMAVGTAVPLLDGSPAALALSAVLVGGTFMVATMAGLQLARERMPHAPTALLARMTSAFAAGQIAGPLLVRAIADRQLWGMDSLSLAGVAATALLAVTAAWLWHEPTSSPGD